MDALSKLKKESINKTRQENPSYADRLIARRCQIILASLLTQTYAAFASMLLNRSLSERESLSYEKAEEFIHVLTSISSIEITPQDLMHNRDECANMAVDDYNAMCEIIEVLEGMEYKKADIMAFCKQVEYENNTFAQFKTEANLHYKRYANLLLFYLTGNYGEEEFTESFVEYDVFTQKTQSVNTRQLMRDMRKILNLFYEIIWKREIRADKHSR